MRWPRFRFRIGGLLGLVALSAVASSGWREYYRPANVWSREILDVNDLKGAASARQRALDGAVAGLTRERAIRELTASLVNPNWAIRQGAIFTVWKFGLPDDGAVPNLIATLNDPIPSNREFAALAIETLVPPTSLHRGRATTALLGSMRRSEKGDILSALHVLNRMIKPGDPEQSAFVAALKAASTHPDPEVRRWAANGLIRQGERKVAEPVVLGLLEISDPSVNDWAVSLMYVHDLILPAAEPVLIRIARTVPTPDPNPNLQGPVEICRGRAAYQLIRLGRADVGTPVLQELSRTGTKRTRSEIDTMFKKMEKRGQSPASVGQVPSPPRPASPPSATPPAGRDAATRSTALP